jgi:hypothetical protein
VIVVNVVLIIVGLILLGISFPAALNSFGDRSRGLPARNIAFILAGLACLFLGFTL